MSDKVLVRKIAPNLWQWRDVTSTGQWSSDAFYTGDINLLKETVEGRLVTLILPGQEFVSERVPADISDRKQLLKVLPFELEEFIIDPVEDLHFHFGPLENESICAVYCDFDILQEAVDEVESTGAEVQRVVADYLQLPLTEQGWTLLLEGDVLLARSDTLAGFAVERPMAPAFLLALVEQQTPTKVALYADNQDELYALNAMLPASIKEEDGPELLEDEAGFWDLLSPEAPALGDFRSGRLARKLPFGKWWNDFKVPAIAATVAFVVALASTWIGLSRVETERRTIMAQTDEIFRQVSPRGNISDPERQLRGLLGNSANTSGHSNIVYLLSGVAPAMHEMDEVVVKSFRYSADNGQLQMNIEAKSFTTFETLRTKIAERGLSVEIKSANVYGDVHQAQLRISEAG